MEKKVYAASPEVVTAISALGKLSTKAKDEESRGILKETLDFLQSRIPETCFKPFGCKGCRNGVLYNRNGKWGCESGCTTTDDCMSNYQPVSAARAEQLEKNGKTAGFTADHTVF